MIIFKESKSINLLTYSIRIRFFNAIGKLSRLKPGIREKDQIET